jgi:hypothetical protein
MLSDFSFAISFSPLIVNFSINVRRFDSRSISAMQQAGPTTIRDSLGLFPECFKSLEKRFVACLRVTFGLEVTFEAKRTRL